MRKAFTLLELLVVIAIISILAALMLPAIKRARNQAKAVVCLNNLRQVFLLVQMYRDESDDRWPGAVTNQDPYISQVTNDLASVNKNLKVYEDPGLPNVISYGWNGNSRAQKGWGWCVHNPDNPSIIIIAWCSGCHGRATVTADYWRNNNILWGDGRATAGMSGVNVNVTSTLYAFD